MQTHLWKSRKHLSIMVGALKAQQPTVSLSPFALQANEFVETEEIEGVARDSSPVPANASPLVLQFFQVLALMHAADLSPQRLPVPTTCASADAGPASISKLYATDLQRRGNDCSLMHILGLQMGEDDERPNGQAAQCEEPEEDADTVAARLWALVCSQDLGLHIGLHVFQSALH